jgi:hypothetical protein
MWLHVPLQLKIDTCWDKHCDLFVIFFNAPNKYKLPLEEDRRVVALAVW